MTADPDAALREKANFILDNPYADPDRDAAVMARAVLKLLERAATASPGLDVERLRDAMDRVPGAHSNDAPRIAREYAALAADREESDIDPNAEWNTPS